MTILVAVKEVIEVGDDFEIDGHDVAEADREHALNEWDEYAIAAAMQVAAARDEEVVTVTVGPERSEETIRMALAKGPDRAIRVWDDAIAGAGELDVAATARLLAAVVEQEAPDLVLTGAQAADDARGATGVALAAAVDYGWAAVVNQLEVDDEAGVARVHRELEGGVEELTEVDLPAVCTVQTGIAEPRYASLGGIRAAQDAEIDVRDLADLGLTAGAVESAVRVTGATVPERESAATRFEGTTDERAAQLADALREAGVDR
jgi:electron transfer flavoprotein beta subunit